MARTALTFSPENRMFPDEYITFGHHRICATTDSPLEWLQKAADNAWSIRQLNEAIKEASGDQGPCEYKSSKIYCGLQGKEVDKAECEGCELRTKQ
jgi:hypothetical protein